MILCGGINRGEFREDLSVFLHSYIKILRIPLSPLFAACHLEEGFTDIAYILWSGSPGHNIRVVRIMAVPYPAEMIAYECPPQGLGSG